MTKKYPVRLDMFKTAEFFIPAGEKWGYAFKLKLREVAKKCPIYHQKVETNIEGTSENGEKIPINTVGRWTFGVPGYAGHIVAYAGKIIVPKESPKEVYELIKFCIANFN